MACVLGFFSYLDDGIRWLFKLAVSSSLSEELVNDVIRLLFMIEVLWNSDTLLLVSF